VVERWDSETLVNRLELQVGRDLQYIRINGTLVGGLVGLIIFSAKQFFQGMVPKSMPSDLIRGWNPVLARDKGEAFARR
jgi:hypothetical protein